MVGFEPLHRSKDVWDFRSLRMRGETCKAAARWDCWVQAQVCRAAPSAPLTLPMAGAMGVNLGHRGQQRKAAPSERLRLQLRFVGPCASPLLSERVSLLLSPETLRLCKKRFLPCFLMMELCIAEKTQNTAHLFPVPKSEKYRVWRASAASVL